MSSLGTELTVHGGSPVGVLQVVADALDGSVPRSQESDVDYWLLNPSPLDLALGSHEEGGAVLLHHRLGRVDQGQPVGDGVLRKGVLLGKVPGKTMC